MEAHAALARTARGVVLDPIALEVRDRAVVELDRHVDDQDALRPLQRFDPVGELAEIRRDAIDLLQEDTPGAEIIGREVRRNRVLGHG